MAFSGYILGPTYYCDCLVRGGIGRKERAVPSRARISRQSYDCHNQLGERQHHQARDSGRKKTIKTDKITNDDSFSFGSCGARRGGEQRIIEMLNFEI